MQQQNNQRNQLLATGGQYAYVRRTNGGASNESMEAEKRMTSSEVMMVFSSLRSL